MTAAVGRRVAWLRQPARAARLAVALWTIWAVVVWNVVFDRVLVLAGRSYVHAAGVAARHGGPYARMDDWMRPALTRGLWLATAAGATILVVGFVSTCLAARAMRPAGRTIETP